MTVILLTILEFFCGSLMFSYWLGKFAKKDLRIVGDGNPGAYNLWASAGYKYGLVGVLFDFLKGYFPLIIFVSFGIVRGTAIIPVAIAPVLGHAFSPFMKFRGGKAVAVTFGVWSAVTGFEVSFAYAVVLVIFMAVVKFVRSGKYSSSETDGVMVVIGMVFVAVYMIIRGFPFEIIALGILNFLVITYTNKMKLHSFYKKYIKK